MDIKRMLFILLFFLSSSLSGRTYYVSALGSDSHTKEDAQLHISPWKTIAKSTHEAQAGDSVIVAEGIYEEGEIIFANSGTPSQWIVLTNAPGTNPQIIGVGVLRAFFIRSRSYIHINGFNLHGYDNDGISIFYSDYIICTNIHAYNNGNAGINVVDSDHIIIQDSELHHNGWKAGGDSGWGNGAGINNHNQSGKTSVFRRNLCYANWQKRANYYWDGNGFTLDMAGPGGLHIVANNVFYNNGGTGLLAGATENIKLVHNIFYRNKSDEICRNTAEIYLTQNETHNTVIKNNIIFSRSGVWTILRSDGDDNAIIGKNLIWGEDGSETQIWWLDYQSKNIDYWISNRANETITGDPDFLSTPFDNNLETFHGSNWIEMDASQYNFKLRPNSQCIDIGTCLTVTASSGSGDQVEVDDAGFFTDGFGQIDGDLIKIGENNPVKIVGIDYATNIITFESKSGISWNGGDPVHLPYIGNAPDIGAYEFSPDQPPTAVVIPDKPSPVTNGLVQISLTTSKTVTKIPSPLHFIESDSTVSIIELTGNIPGFSFSGEFNVSDIVAEGIGHFLLQENALVDELGNKGNEITHGYSLRIDRIPPQSPQNINLGN